ncbi:hypothetical protein [Rhizobium sp. BK491]|uniref:hypothetical protein n=1 Tax=Rhizobium sp. BK491 TaxID=2587009 RepID=UPI00185EF291|nr:hypothetical protein [Rhizobium sp. BK491]MBB3571259.1 hypothetical protein [Rhizobium sp. BK491]
MYTSPVSDKHHRFPPQIIAHAVWLYFWFPLSLRVVEELLLFWTRSSSPLPAGNTGYGVPSIRTGI